MNSPESQFNPEIVHAPETEQRASHVVLHLERHGDRAGEVLSDKGKSQLFEKGKERGKSGRQAVAIGSNIERAQHSAALDMAGSEQTPYVTGDESLEELRIKLDAAGEFQTGNKKFGSRIGSDPRLGFFVGSGEFAAKTLEAYNAKQGLKFLVDKSDALAREHGEKVGLTYSRKAADVAEIVKKYAGVAEKFHSLLADPEKQKEYGDTLERYLGSHAGVVETFLAKVIEKMKGVPERDAFVEAAGHGAGFDTSEGYEISIDVTPGSKEPEVRVTYEKKDVEGKTAFLFNESVPAKLIDEIIEEGDILKAN